MLVSVHLPKTAGTSFGQSLADHFGDRLFRDYEDSPLNTAPMRRKVTATLGGLRHGVAALRRFDCVHGHFLAGKYLPLRLRRPVRFVTWMRDPVERLASHYEFWRRSYDPHRSLPLHRRVVEEDWPFERFYRSPEMRDVYSQFLWRFDLSKFEFIGITEHYEADFGFFAATFLGTSQSAHHVETNAGRGPAPYVTDPSLRAEIESVHRNDMLLYRRALDLRRRTRGSIDGTPPAFPL
jgi:hypothetical protein